MIKKSAFTLIEMIAVIVIMGIIVPLIFVTFTRIQKLKQEIDLQSQLNYQTYTFLEKLGIRMQDYTIDYEEYFNRKMVGCSNGGGSGSSFARTGTSIISSGYCDQFTAYGNENSLDLTSFGVNTGDHVLWYCTSDYDNNTLETLLQNRAVRDTDAATTNCLSTPPKINFSNGRQSFLQYAALFYDIKNIQNTADDEDLGRGPVAITGADQAQELYLISQDGKSRLYFRRKLLEIDEATGEKKYGLQMLRLKGFDAGIQHNFDNLEATENEGVFDGQIDTWACDTEMGFEPENKIHSVGAAYANYYLPNNVDDCWVDVFPEGISLSGRNVTLSPVSQPELARQDDAMQLNPYIKIVLTNRLYSPYRRTANAEFLKHLSISIEHMFSVKSFYRG